ncbi:MAG: Rho termination factor N-terminal domain-containing protein [Solirubrobacteraceae bacterium]
MSVLDRSELEASPLADLHAIADQLGLDGFRRLRKAELIGTILGEPAKDAGGSNSATTSEEQPERERPPRRRRLSRARSSKESAADRGRDGDGGAQAEIGASEKRQSAEKPESGERPRTGKKPEAASRAGAGRGSSSGAGGSSDRTVEGVVDLLGNGSAFLRVDPPEPSDDDVYISAAQVRRCELVSGDRVTGPVRTPRRSERYPSLVRIDTINGKSADEVSEGAHYEDLPVAYPSERLVLDAGDPTLDAIQWLTPLGRGSRVTIVGPPRAGKTETAKRLLGALKDSGSEVTVVLAGARPEEIAEWREGGEDATVPVAALSFAASADAQGQAVERAIEAAKRGAARGGNALVLIDGLDGLHPLAARRALAAARNLRDGGSLTVIATAARPLGGETTVIALDHALAGSGLPQLDLMASGTIKPELLVGEDGAKAIAKARAEVRDSS